MNSFLLIAGDQEKFFIRKNFVSEMKMLYK